MDEVRAVVDEAHRHGKPVVAHSHRPEEIRRGLQAGVDCFEHTGLATAPAYPDDIMAMIRERTAKMSLGPLFWTPDDRGAAQLRVPARQSPRRWTTRPGRRDCPPRSWRTSGSRSSTPTGCPTSS